MWFYGGCPKGLQPDHHIFVKQDNENKWKNVSTMLDLACRNNYITKDFWLFNDDFFIMEKIDKPRNYYRGDLYKRIVQLEDKTEKSSKISVNMSYNKIPPFEVVF